MLAPKLAYFNLRIKYSTGDGKVDHASTTFQDENVDEVLRKYATDGLKIYGMRRDIFTWIPPHRIINIEVTYVEAPEDWID